MPSTRYGLLQVLPYTVTFYQYLLDFSSACSGVKEYFSINLAETKSQDAFNSFRVSIIIFIFSSRISFSLDHFSYIDANKQLSQTD